MMIEDKTTVKLITARSIAVKIVKDMLDKTRPYKKEPINWLEDNDKLRRDTRMKTLRQVINKLKKEFPLIDDDLKMGDRIFVLPLAAERSGIPDRLINRVATIVEIYDSARVGILFGEFGEDNTPPWYLDISDPEQWERIK